VKSRTVFVCRECGAKSPRWQGRCNTCGAWDSFVEENVSDVKKQTHHLTGTDSGIVRLGDVSAEAEYRFTTGISELDRVLGGGVIPGSIVLVGGDPGIGKSTLMLQMCSGMNGMNPLYITGEESLKQIKYRSARLDNITDDLLLMAETNAEVINDAIKDSNSNIVIIDSIQSIHSDKFDATPGTILQVRECASMLMQTAKTTGKAIFIIGHVTKEGVLAGPKIMEHIVDTVLQFEGEKIYSYRILRALKNRFGSTNEIGIFEMGESGLTEVTNPSEMFLAESHRKESGIAIVAAIEGTRPLLLEAQALVSPSGYGMPQRSVTGYDSRRLSMILAVLEKRLGEKFRTQDVFVNVAGGVYLNDPSVDLGIAAALMSSLRDKPLNADTAFVGEIGLTGEVRHVHFIEQRIAEAQKLGFKRIIIPKSSMKKLPKSYDIELIPVERISLALPLMFT
jgi:DNA repair protein RadA/Sms